MKYDYPIAVVTWLDACTHNDGDGPPRHEPMRQVTAGWLLKRDRKGVSIAFEYNDSDNTYRDEQFIPAGMVESVRIIKT
jgi:hypothetical protein